MDEKSRLTLLKTFSELNGVPGNEKQIAQQFAKEVKGFADKVEYDNLGSILAYKMGKPGQPVVMLSGHMDEVGFLVHKIENSGLIRLHPVGGWWGHVLLAQVMRITTRSGKEIMGVIGAKPPHGMTPEARKQVIEIKDMFLDLGVYSKEAVEKLGISIGDMVTPHTDFRILNDGKTLLGKAWDNRIGVTTGIEVLKNLKGVDHAATVVAAGTVQEEVGSRGARTASFHIKPDIAFAIDVTMSYDFPGAPEFPTKLGTGLALSILDGSVIAHRGLFDFVENICKKQNVKYTYDLLTAGGTDSGEIHKQFDGVITMTLSLPCRYFHSHTSLIHYEDYSAMVDLLTEVVKSINSEVLKDLKESKFR